MLTFYSFIYLFILRLNLSMNFPGLLTCAAAWGVGSSLFCKPDVEFEEVAVPLLPKDDFYIDEEPLWHSK